MVLGSFLLSALVLAQTPAPQGPASEDEIAAAVRRLGDDDFSVREEASAFLWKAGKAAKAALEAAADSDDREVAIRAKEVLDRVKLGITPDSPPDLLQLVFSFQRGGIDHKRTVLAQLRQKQQQTTMFVLIRNEPDEAIRKQLAREFVMESRRVVIDLIVAGDVSGAEEMLSWTASFDESTRSQRDYAAFLHSTGRLEQKISSLRSTDDSRREPNAARLLATCLQVQGELRDALQVANAAGDRSLQNDLLYRLEDWAALAREEQLPDGLAVEKLGAKAAYRHWAGDQAGFEAVIAELIALPQTNNEQAWLIAEVLLCNGRWEDAGAILRKWDRNSAFQVLVAQLKYRQALTLAGVDDVQQAATWYSERAKAVAANTQESWQHFLLGLRVSRLLNDLGEEDAAIALLSKAADFPADKEGLRSFNVFVEDVRQGRRDAALRRGAILMSTEARAAGVATELFGVRSASALQWWQLLRERSPGDDPAETLKQLQAMFDPARDWPFPDKTLEQLTAQAADGVPALEVGKRFPRMWAIVELAVQRQEKKLARKYLEQAEALSATTINATPPQWIGDLLAEEKDWSAAAAAYGRAWQRDKSVAITLYMHGHALAQAGDKEEGERLMRLASLLPLADPVRRREFAEGLALRGLKDQAVQQRELVVRFGAAGTWAGNDDWHFRDAARLLGDNVEMTDPARAAVLWQRVMYGVIRTNSHYWERSDYAKMFSVIHKVRARALLAAGKPDEGIQNLNLAVAARPGEIPLVEQLMPALIAADRKEAAEKLFADAYAAYEEICREFPTSARNHNELAWLSARNDRRLDDALTHAQEAVRLRPEALNFRDTLAEVHFRRGDRDKAEELAKQNLMKEPNNKHFQEQVKRFEK